MVSVRKTRGEKLVSTFSIAACDPETGELGVAVQSKFLAVGAFVPFAKAGVGAIATQSLCNTSYGPRGLALLEEGKSVEEVLEILTSSDDQRELRQVGIVDAKGNAANFTGKECFEWAGGRSGPNYTCQGNILVSQDTVDAMAETFEKTEGELARRLVAALEAGQEAGGDSRGRQSAAILVVKPNGGYGGFNDRYMDLRVDDHPTPIKELIRLMDLFDLYFKPTDPNDLVKIEDDLVKEIQERLAKLGYYKGNVTGEFDASTKEALKTFHLIENFDERIREDDYIDGLVLNFLREKTNK
ncbi:MAG: DUF1028 domain-containing protein [Firmicutes bacterium]|nr:DUF1028 domain-containing protein [Bacillota bacterium]